eukprot:TRINITY_DN77114_c0_g1_i1.p1 TRINITY_DN77114_c0_g1~~TRINITY_DN77114_c0_g1_i1.p1  ORF type:complete len:184 (-),score=26.39 TRINITY_DN77114_c0_g1_i1:59-610(-)
MASPANFIDCGLECAVQFTDMHDNTIANNMMYLEFARNAKAWFGWDDHSRVIGKWVVFALSPKVTKIKDGVVPNQEDTHVPEYEQNLGVKHFGSEMPNHLCPSPHGPTLLGGLIDLSQASSCDRDDNQATSALVELEQMEEESCMVTSTQCSRFRRALASSGACFDSQDTSSPEVANKRRRAE